MTTSFSNELCRCSAVITVETNEGDLNMCVRFVAKRPPNFPLNLYAALFFRVDARRKREKK